MERWAERGLTLVELLIVFALLGLLLATTLGFLTSMFRRSGEAGIRNQVQTKGILLSEEILKVLRATGSRGLSLHEDEESSGFSAVGLETITTTGQQVWEDTCVVYYWRKEESQMYRRDCPPLPPGATLRFAPDTPPLPGPSEFAALFSSEGGRPISSDVALFSLTKSEGLASFDLRLEKLIGERRVEKFSVRREVSFKS